MSDERAYALLNVFALPELIFSGNALAVFSDARGLDERAMRAIAKQTNLAETTFVFAGDEHVDAHVRIFTTSVEMPFAGHPTLGTAEVVARSLAPRTHVRLAMKAGVVSVTADDAGRALRRWTLETAVAPTSRDYEHRVEDAAAMLGIPVEDLAGTPRWMDTGTELLVVPLVSFEAVRRVKPVSALLGRHAFSARAGEAIVYVYAREAGRAAARFFTDIGGAVIEDPATGSACANLGGALFLAGERAVELVVEQGAEVGRPSRLELHVDSVAEGRPRIRVGGLVRWMGEGRLRVG